ncbi:hypothetical protein AGDE_13872 [Angomonas deanei]|nr:hypothetical protein AGDE_13872 [Angomonas deanei]|eukprot:EPY21681.1 hypothetical protein AGDE_13872 [Angomonas deanei]
MEEADKAAVPVVMTVQPRQIDKRPPLLFLIEEEATGTVDYDRRQSRALGPVPDANEEARHYAEHRPQVVPYFQSEDMPPTDWDDVTYYRDTQTDDFTQTPQPIPAKKSGKRKKTKAPGSRYPPLPHSSRGVTPRETASQRTPPKDNYWSFVTPSNNTTKKTSARYASSGRAPERSTTPYTSGTHLAKIPSRSATPLGRYTDSPYLQNYPRRQITSAPPARTGGYDERPTQFSNTFTAGAAPSRTRYDLNSGDRVSSHYINGSYRYCDLQTGKMMQHRPGGYVDEELAGYNDARMQRLSDRRQY